VYKADSFSTFFAIYLLYTQHPLHFLTVHYKHFTLPLTRKHPHTQPEAFEKSVDKQQWKQKLN